jgi:kinesin family protein 3/17
LKVRDRGEGVFNVDDCKKLKVESAEQMLAILNAGRSNRAKGETDMNKDSSRSHSLFTIIIENSSIDQTGETRYRMGKLNLVDLAGSERLSKTHATGQRVEEAKHINLSLHMLGIVISKLVTGDKHIPYRDSVLTKLLSDSLGGNTKTIMIANIGPADYNYEESVNTLRYAWDAKKIKNKPKINEDPKDAMLRNFQEEIESLKQELAKRTGKVYTGKSGETVNIF